MSTLKVNTIQDTTGDTALTFDSSGNTTISKKLSSVNGNGFPSAGALSHRNLIINGAMQVAQRGTSSTDASFATVDRWENISTGTDEAQTQAQITLTSSDTGPWAKGFRNAYQITNGNQTSGAGAGDYSWVAQPIEAQNLANSGWDYTSASSYITLSFWVKSSVAQNFYGRLQTVDGTVQNYTFETGSLSANTWTKVTKIIPGHANNTINNDNGKGLEIELSMLRGTDYTHSVTLNQWAAYATDTRHPDSTVTWNNTNDAVFMLTGVQLEVAAAATEYEFVPWEKELLRCQRYYYHIPTATHPGGTAGIGNGHHFGLGFCPSTSIGRIHIQPPVPMRADPASLEWSGTQGDYVVGNQSAETQCNGNLSFSSQQAWNSRVNFPASSLTAGEAVQGMAYNSSAFLGFEAEL